MSAPKLTLRTDASLVSTRVPTRRALEIEFTAPEAHRGSASAPLNLALVIDRSGSMGGGKLEQAKLAVGQILDLMRPVDSVSIVDFDNVVTVTAEADAVTPGTREEMKREVNNMRPRGSTDLGGGWLTGCERVAHRQSDGRVNRTLLLTDGQANVGIVSIPELSGHASALFERGVATSTFGIGRDFNEHLLEAMANHGGGNYYYIDSDQRIPELLLEEFKDLAAVTLKNVVLEFNFPAGVSAELLGDWRAEASENRLVINLSDLPANRQVNLFINLLTPPGSGQLVMSVIVHGRDEADKPFQLGGDVTLQYATPEKVADAEAARDPDLVARHASVALGHFSNQAYKLEREGKFEEAGKLMDRLMLEHGANIPSPTRQRYERITREVRVGLDETQRKEYNMDSYLLKKHRHDEQRKQEDQK
jgi:Ca-activated chloride channel family protein